ncbi:MAG: serine protease [Nocardioides sp.]|nr:serine protease [Nocardioides sp.]
MPATPSSVARVRPGSRSRRARLRVGALLVGVFALVASGLTLVTPAQAIVGGEFASPGEGRFMVSVQDRARRGSDAHFCGGSVVRKRWVLTAAHCVTDTKPKDLRLVVGRQNLDGSGGRALRVKRIVIHPRYASTGTHDVALLRTGRRVGVPRIPLVRVGNDSHEQSGAPLTVAGWGTTFFLVGPISPQLKKVDVRAVADEDCVTNGLMGFNPETEMCAEELGGDSCQGDSGGPLFGKNAKGKPVQVGVVSYGLGCATPLFPGVYAEVNSPPIRSFLVRTIRRARR